MAKRPVFVVSDSNYLTKKEMIEFDFFSGFSKKQKQKCIESLHKEFLKMYPKMSILEISSKSPIDIGVKLSAFNLRIKLIDRNDKISVETLFQSSKVFEFGGPYRELVYFSPKEAKKDARLKDSGNLVAFNMLGKEFPITPKTYFYNWIYVNALNLNKELREKVLQYDAFTDIEFNDKKSINCQAEAAAIFVSLYRQGLLEEALKDEKAFLNIVYSTDNNVKFVQSSIL